MSYLNQSNSGYITIKREIFYKMWNMLEGNPFRKNLISELDQQRVKELKEKDLLLEEESLIAKVWHPKSYKISELSDDEIAHTAMYNDINNIRFVKNLTPEYANNWINIHRLSTLKIPALKFIMKNKVFTRGQKIAVLYKFMQFSFEEKVEKKYEKELKKIFSYFPYQKELERALSTLLWYENPSDEELKGVILQALDLEYKQQTSIIHSEIAHALNRKLNNLKCRGVLNSCHDFAQEAALCMENHNNIFDVNYQNEEISYLILNALNSNVYTCDDIKKCHLGHLIPNSQYILSTV